MNAEATWNRFALTEPYFSVLTKSRFLRVNFDARVEEEFFDSGESYVAKVFDLVRQHITPLFAPRSVLEFGCGPGRVAIPLARVAPDASVLAVDVAPEMRRLAAGHAARAGATNLRFDTPEAALAARHRFDLINGSLVFHHIPQHQGIPLLARLLQRLADRGVGAFSFPYRRHSNAIVNAFRWTRRRVPGVNQFANTLMRRPPDLPFLQPYIYDLSRVMSTLEAAGCGEVHMLSERQGDVEIATLVFRRIAEDSAEAPDEKAEIVAATEREQSDGFIDVRKLIASASIEELNKKAEEYFAGLATWEHHLAKPFANPSDTPPILINFAVLLEGLKLYPGLTVLEFGAGTGWLSRYLTQLGCRSIVMDVSPTALKIGEELYKRLPVIGDRPTPQFIQFDGHRMDLPDESVDRVVTFDAFHHVTNPDDVLAEFARVLRPGGIAAFAEPGPHHSKTAQSQFEMRTYGVVENDVDIRAIWSTAQKLGFSDIRLAAFNARPFHVGLDEYEDLLQAGETYLRWANWTREFMVNVRDFFLIKGGSEATDSRRADAVAARTTVQVPERVDRNTPIAVRATLENIGPGTWLPASAPLGGVSLGCHLFRADGTLADFEHHREPLWSSVAPGGSVDLTYELPPLPNGRWTLEFDLVADRVIWFAQTGSTTARVQVVVG